MTSLLTKNSTRCANQFWNVSLCLISTKYQQNVHSPRWKNCNYSIIITKKTSKITKRWMQQQWMYVLYCIVSLHFITTYTYIPNPIIGIMYSKMLVLCMQRIEIDFIHSSVCMGLRWLLCGIDEGLGLNGQTYSSWMIGGDCVSSPISSNQYLVLLPKDDEPHQPMNPFGKKPWSSLTTG